MTRYEQMATHQALLAATDGVLREVVELHTPEPSRPGGGFLECRGCDAGAHAEYPPDWPCGTTELIAERLGVPLRPDSGRTTR